MQPLCCNRGGGTEGRMLVSHGGRKTGCLSTVTDEGSWHPWWAALLLRLSSVLSNEQRLSGAHCFDRGMLEYLGRAESAIGAPHYPWIIPLRSEASLYLIHRANIPRWNQANLRFRYCINIYLLFLRVFLYRRIIQGPYCANKLKSHSMKMLLNWLAKPICSW